MRLDARHWWIGVPAVALLSAAASFYQPRLAQRTGVLVWGESYCGSYDNGELVGLYSGSVLWWTFTSAILTVGSAAPSFAGGRAKRRLPTRPSLPCSRSPGRARSGA
jgi:hypothetical protein